ncbi:MAG: Type 1 glutamine amidotransferase-like domain-containing protein [Patescibacteria group bacterium]|jgi:dipeptidase E
MKLLLTSSGLANDAIKKVFFDLVGKQPEEISLAFIPTASNVETGDKSWLAEDIQSLENLGLGVVNTVDISAVERSVWEAQLRSADVLFFEGGNNFYLMDWVNKSGLVDLLPEFLETKVYVGVSAGSMITGPDLLLSVSQQLYEEDLEKTENMAGLNLVDFYILPHYNSSYFSLVREEGIRSVVEGIRKKIYVLDDDSAVKVEGDRVEVIGSGDCLEIN